MKNFAIFLVLFPTLLPTAAETKPAGGWQETGELAYSYAYARSVLGHRMRSAGWVCTFGFTAGRHREQEHSVWQKGRRKMQLMIWRIDTGRTGYAKGEIREENLR